MRMLAIALALIGGFSLEAASQEQDVQKVCSGASPDMNAIIAACTKLIGSGKLTNDESSRVLNNRGAIYSMKGDKNRAIADFNKAIRLRPDYASAFNNRGNIHKEKGDIDRAIADFSEAIRFKPDYVEAFINRSSAYEIKGDKTRASADITEARRLFAKR
jgi:lipoprotein NlpI